MILDDDTFMQAIAAKHGYFPTQDKERDAVIPIDNADLSYALPEGFHITSMKDSFDEKHSFPPRRSYAFLCGKSVVLLIRSISHG